ncbi:DUF7543 family protein [Halalkalirubrum salinum]|uniref:DUF7543 family protein n=1 Tax=Halalkalirubrum salinum TaxID=2563889 RepID=UPI0010FAEEC6|nr:hypothetical protein [Halalkalirubrum salinum]
MEWTVRTETDRLTEWQREDGYVTIRKRERPDGRFVVRLDKLEQAEGGRAYDHAIVDTDEAAAAIVSEWRQTNST